jgi:hypothetical protein
LGFAANIATLGASGATEAAANSTYQALKNAYNSAKPYIQAGQDTARLEAIATAPNATEAMRSAAGFDPTGVSGVVGAFAYSVCKH